MDSYQKLEKYLKVHELRHTYERTNMLDFIVQLDGHFTVPQLLEQFAKPWHISRVSIYRNLNLFVDADIVVVHPFPGDEKVYELTERAVTHCHRVCMRCGAVKEFTDMRASKLLNAHRFRHFSKISTHAYIYGVCAKCREKK